MQPKWVDNWSGIAASMKEWQLASSPEGVATGLAGVATGLGVWLGL